MTAERDSAEALVLVERRGPCALVTLNRAGKRNAVNIAMADQLLATLTALEDASVIIVTGDGETSFCAGVDLKERGQKRAWHTSLGVARGQYWFEVNEAIRRHPAVFVAAVNGYALGGGLTLVNNSELAIASETATFGMPELSFGAFPALAGPTTIRRLLPKHAAEMIFLTQRISAARAQEWGLINEVVPPERLRDRAWEVGEAVATWNPAALGLAKRAVREISEPRWSNDMDYGNHIASLVIASRQEADPEAT